MPPPLNWVAGTPDGARLGEMAAREVELRFQLSPWWTAPIEPVRWVQALISVAPHQFYTLALFAVLSLGFALAWTRRRRSLRALVAAALTFMLTLVGAQQAIRTVDTLLPSGTVWHVPDGAPYRLANLHTHTQASGGVLMPEDVVDWHYAHGYRVVAITDSNGIRGVARAQARAAETGGSMIVVPGEEYRGRTHLLLLNVRSPIVATLRSVTEAMGDAQAQGALVLVAHPWTSDLSPDELVAAGARGFEMTNGHVIASDATRALADRRGLALTGNLDFRSGQNPLTATVLPGWADTPEKVQQALEKGECAALYLGGFVDRGGFSYLAQLGRVMRNLVYRRTRLLLGGLAFWLGAWLVARGRVRIPPARVSPAAAFAVIFAGAALTAVITVWSMWWRFRVGWFPRTEWALAVWAVATPLAWWTLPAACPRAGDATDGS